MEDADVTFQLWELLKPKLESQGQSKTFYEIESPLLPVLVSMEQEGISLNESSLQETGKTLALEINRLQESIFQTAGRDFNLNSPKQLGIVLFEDLKLVEKPKRQKQVSMQQTNKSSQV